MNNKGQALVEFVIILPVFLILIFAIVDFGTIINNKSTLENDSNEIIEMYKNGSKIEDIKKIYKDISISATDYKQKYIKIKLQKEINLITPGINRIIDNPYKLKVERVIINA